MCRITDSGHQCLKDWGFWASRDSTIKRLGYRGCSAEQMAGHVMGGDHEENYVAELVDRLVVGLLEERYRLVAKFIYVDRLSMRDAAVRITEALAASGVSGVKRVSLSMVNDDLIVLRSMVGGVVLWAG